MVDNNAPRLQYCNAPYDRHSADPYLNMTMESISAAGRLLAIIKRASGQPGQTLVFPTWGNVFGIPPDDRAAVYAAIAGVYRLVDNARDEVRSHPDLKQDLYLGALSNIEAAITNAQMNAQWGQFVSQLQGSNLIALEFVAEQLDRFSSEQLVEQSLLDELRAMIEKVTNELAASDIDPELRRLLSQKLEDARHAILFYSIDGADGLRRAAEAAVGTVMVMNESAKPEQSKKPFVDYVDAINKMLDIVSKAKPLAALVTSGVRALLTSGSR